MSVYIEIGTAMLTKNGEELCGDTIGVSRTDDATIMVLSDGLGSGVKANILSTLTTKIATTMLVNGASLDDVVQTIGGTLPTCKVRHLAYSTFTIVQIFHDDRSTYIAEFDNPPTMLLRDGKVIPVPGEISLIEGKKIRESHLHTKDGDFLISMSDGLIHSGIGGVLNLGWKWDNVAKYVEKVSEDAQDASSLAEWLVSVSHQLYAGRPGDDVSVAVLKVRQPRTATVLVGPPQRREDDPVVAGLLLAETGKRIVCGGTTSMLIARELGRELKVSLERLDPKIPPGGRIQGLDLVTEGIITISQALKYLKSASSSGDLKETDEAAQLAKTLLASDKINFIDRKSVV